MRPGESLRVRRRVALCALSVVFWAFCGVAPLAQSRIPRSGGNGAQAAGAAKEVEVVPSVRAWRMADGFTRADTVVVDTVLAEHQVSNPIWRRSLANVTLGNLGSPSVPTFYPALRRDGGNPFYTALMPIMLGPEDFTFYNTKTPYANLTYQKGIPKARREEFFSALFTQNVNRRLNIGARLDINASIGRYVNQAADNSKFGMWMSYDGDVYKAQLQAWYQKFQIEENGGITNDSIVLFPDLYDYDNAEDYPVVSMDARNRLATYRLLLSQSLDLGSVTRTEGDSVDYDVPVATAYYKFYADKSHHEFAIADLSTYTDDEADFIPAVYIDPSRTFDSRKYMLISNEFQLRLNEEFNSLLRFGLRLFVGNEVRQYYWDARSELLTDEETGDQSLVFHRQKRNRVSSYMGGQIFKNIGRRFRWNAGVKLVFQGYNSGDVNADGGVSLSLGTGRWATELWGRASFELRSPSLWEDRYCSNHYEWDQSLDREQNFDVRGGVRIPGIGVDLGVFSSTLNNRIYFSPLGVPAQKSDVTQLLGFNARAHLTQSRTGFNTIVRLAFQRTSDNDVVPAPSFALFATSYWERLFFGVMLTQIGFDVHYNSRFYSPAYIPALMQFVPQDQRRMGGYGYFDPFINFHLKKIRAYVKFEHLNNLWGSNDHFNTIHYPAIPHTFKFGLSWNFYD